MEASPWLTLVLSEIIGYSYKDTHNPSPGSPGKHRQGVILCHHRLNFEHRIWVRDRVEAFCGSCHRCHCSLVSPHMDEAAPAITVIDLFPKHLLILSTCNDGPTISTIGSSDGHRRAWNHILLRHFHRLVSRQNPPACARQRLGAHPF